MLLCARSLVLTQRADECVVKAHRRMDGDDLSNVEGLFLIVQLIIDAWDFQHSGAFLLYLSPYTGVVRMRQRYGH